MIVSFCGHSRLFGKDFLEDKILKILEAEIKGEKVDFYLGAYGDFDSIAKMSCSIYQKTHSNSKLYFISPYVDNTYLKNLEDMIKTYDGIIYPEIENTPKRFAIVARNKWMVRQADLIIAYVDYSWGGAVKTLDYALKIKKHYINLGNYIPEK